MHMGQSTDAILFYGYCWDEEGAELWPEGEEGEREEPDARLARLSGVEAPDDAYPPDTDRSADAERTRKAFSKYWDACREVDERCGVEVDHHCSGDCPIPYVAVKASKTTANRGYPKTIMGLDVGCDWDKMLADYCGLMGITPPQEKPEWWLVSMWS
jgi:hypothetical protein